MDNVYRTLLCSLALFCVVSCGGGGSGTDNTATPTTPTVPTTPPVENNSLFKKYAGITTQANVDNSDAYDITYHTTSIADLAMVLSYADEIPYVRFDSVLPNGQISQSGDCDSGQFIVGELSGDSVDVEYIDCTSNNYTFNGKGTLKAIEYNSSGELSVGELSFNSLTINNGRATFEFEGTILANVGPSTTDSAIYNALIKNTSSGEQYYLDNFTIGLGVDGEFDGYAIQGRLYLSPFGYVDVETLQKADSIASLSVAVVGKNTLVIEQLENGQVGVGLFADIDSISDARTTVSFSSIANLEFRSEANTAPNAVVSLTDNSTDKNTPFALDASNSSDAENDILSYNWEVITKPDNASVSFANNGFINSTATFDYAGNYTLRLTVDDGKVQAPAVDVNLYVRQDPPNVSFSVGYTELPFAEPLHDEVIIDNPQDDGPFTLTLNTAPQGMQLAQDGSLEWDGKIPRFGYDMNVNYTVKVANNDHEFLLSNSLNLVDPDSTPIFRTDEHPKTYFKVIDFNQDLEPDIFVTQASTGQIISATSGKILWSTSLPDTDIENVALDSENGLLYLAMSKTGDIYAIDIESQSQELIATLGSEISEFRSTFLIEGSQSSMRFAVLGRNKLYNFKTESFKNYPDYVLAVSDINQDGVSDIFTNNGIYQTDNMELLVSTINASSNNFSAKFIDIDNDNIPEVFLVATQNEGQDARYDLTIFKIQNGNLVPVQTLIGGSNYMSYAVSADMQTLYIVENGKNIAIYEKQPNNKFEKAETRPISNLNITYSDAFNSPYDACRLVSVSNEELVMRCTGKITGTDQYVSNYSTIDVSQSTLALMTSLNTSNEYNSFGNILSTNNDDFIVGQYTGTLFLSSDQTINRLRAPSNSLEDGYTFESISEESNSVFGWEIKTGNSLNSLTKTDIFSGTTITYEIPINGSFPKYSFFTSDELGYVLIRVDQTLIVVLQSNLQEIKQLKLSNLDNRSDISAAKSFSYNGESYAALWLDNSLLILKESNGDFILDREVTIPDENDYSPTAETSKIMSISVGENGPKISLLRNAPFRSGQNRFKLIHYMYTSETFSISDVETPRYLSTYGPTLDYCISTDEASNRQTAYIISTTFAVDPEYQEDDLHRPAKVSAIDLTSGELVWASNTLMPDEDRGALNAHIACDKYNSLPRLAFTTQKFLYMTN